MLDPNAYTTRAYYAGPADYTKILVDGVNHYAGQLMAIINDAPHEDLPLILAMLRIASESLANEVKMPSYVPFLVSLIKEHSSSMGIKARVPKKGGEPDA